MALTKVVGSGIGTVTNQFADANMSAGSAVQVVNVQTGAVATGTTTVPLDDTIPQITEGTEFMTLAITPTSATNKLRIEVLFLGVYPADAVVTLMLFQDSTANALACNDIWSMGTSTRNFSMYLSHFMTAGTTSETTFKVRVGRNGSSTVRMNGTDGSRFFGGVLGSGITITEIGA